MWSAIRLFLRTLVRLAPRDKQLIVCGVVILALLIATKATAGQFEYRGVYKVQSILVNYCDNCYLELPPDYLNSEVVLAVDTDSETQVFKALQKASAAIGWTLTRSNKVLRADPVQNEGNVVYISCLDNQPKNVPKYLYAASVKSDRILCEQRDSLAAVERARADSVKAFQDSVKAIPPLDFAHYELRYIAYSKSFTDKMGMEWNSIILSGNLRDKFEIFDDWRLWATENDDTSFTQRGLFFSVDTSLAVDWGSEEQTIKQTFVNDGVTTSDYEWRKYGLLVKVTRDGKRVRMDYVFRDKDNSVSVLQGSVIGTESDTLRLFGEYTSRRTVTLGIPFLSRIPFLKYVFSTEHAQNDIRRFELYLLPINKGDKNGQGKFETRGNPTWTGYGKKTD